MNVYISKCMHLDMHICTHCIEVPIFYLKEKIKHYLAQNYRTELNSLEVIRAVHGACGGFFLHICIISYEIVISPKFQTH